MDSCMTCGYPMKLNVRDERDCYHCNPENFFGFTNRAKSVLVSNNSFSDINQVDSPIFTGGDPEILEFVPQD